MNDFFDKENYSEEDIKNLIDIEAEESVNLEFKSGDSLANSDGKKTEIAKDVSAFANSDGGIIVYGIAEKDFKANSLVFVNGKEFTKEWLEQVINSRIQKRISNVRIVPIRFFGDISKTVYVVKIPASNGAPHISFDKRYYKRFNFQSVAMEEYEIRDLFNRKQKTEIEIGDILFVQGTSALGAERLRYVEYLVRFQIHNIGNTIEDKFKLEVYIPKDIVQNDASNEMKKHKIRDEGIISVYSVPSVSPIYQNEITTVVNGKITINKISLQLLEHPGIRLKAYYSSGMKEKTFNLLDTLTYRTNAFEQNGHLLKNQTWGDE